MLRILKDISTTDVLLSTGIIAKAAIGGFLLVASAFFLVIINFAPSVIPAWHFSIGVQLLLGYFPFLIGLLLLFWSIKSMSVLREGGS